jgi:hypothetical protein
MNPNHLHLDLMSVAQDFPTFHPDEVSIKIAPELLALYLIELKNQ